MRNTSRARRILAAVAISALTLSACGSDDSGTSSTPSAPAAGGSGDVVDVNVWIAFTDDRLDWTQGIAEQFNQQLEGYRIVVSGYDSYEALFDATLLAFDQGNPPAVVQYFEAATIDAINAVSTAGEPIFRSIEGAIAGRSEILGVPVMIDDVVASARNYYTIDGELKSMPWNTSSATMFTNVTLMESLGVTTIPSTWQELEAACDTVMSAANAPTGCVTWPNHGWFFEQTLAQQGATYVNNDNGRSGLATEINIDSPEMIDYLTFWASLEDKGHYIYTGTQRDWGGTYDLFSSQGVPFLIYSSSDTTLLTNEGVNGGFDVVSTFMPRNANRPAGGNIIGGASLWLVDGLDSGMEDAALAFMNFLNNPANAAEWHQVTGYIPITEASVALLEAEGWFDSNPNSRVANDQLSAAPATSATAGALLGNFGRVRNVVTEAAEDILVNNRDVAARLAEAQVAAQQLIDEFAALYG
jgi:sn-glycerol 3-phosphate transport system substrate-binding protein